MSQYNRKGFKTVHGRTDEGDLKPFAVRVGGAQDKRNQRAVRKARREKAEKFRAYKDKLREQKKHVPHNLRAKVNWSKVPERLFDDGITQV